MDGGSIGLTLADEAGSVSHLMMNKSVGAIGTSAFNQVTDANGPLTKSEMKQLSEALQTIREKTDSSDPCFELLRDFSASLRQAAYA